jgi:uncharacterized protein
MAILPQNAIMFTHNDLDGIGGGILFKAALGSQAEVHYCGYHNVDEKINQRLDELEISGDLPFIVVADLGIKPETAARLDRYKGEKRWLDHHKTNIELAANYDWATIDVEASGTLLVFGEFENVPRKYRDFAIHVDDYDRWIHSLPKSKELNRLYFILGIDRFEFRFLKNEKVDFDNNELLLLELEEETIERYTNKVERGLTVYELAGDKRIGIGFAERYQSEVAHNLLDAMDLDAIALIDVNYRKISFRSKADFDIGSIAKRLGGGGHKNAAGAEFNYGRIDDFHGNKYPLIGVFQNFQSMIFELYWKVKRTFEAIETEEIEKLFKGVK